MTNSRICILCLIGLPGAGKTYLANEICKSLLNFTHFEHICYDKLIQWEDNSNTWRTKRKSVLNGVENKINDSISKMCSSESILFIIDDNMYYRSMRYEFYKLCRRYRTKFCEVFLDTPVDICFIRNRERLESVPSCHIVNIDRKLEHPLAINNWEKCSLILNYKATIAESLNMVESLIMSASVPNEIIEEVEHSKNQSFKHIADIALRKIVGILVKELRCYEKEKDPEKLESLNKIRQETLKKIQSGDIYLPDEQNIDRYIQYLMPFFQKEGY